MARLKFLEQPTMLDGDDGLTRERHDELDLPFRERSYLAAPERQPADGHALPQHRHRKARPIASEGLDRRAVISRHRPNVFDLYRRSVQDGAPYEAVRSRGKREDGPEDLELWLRYLAVRVDGDLLTVEEMETAKGGVAQPHSPTDDRIEYWLSVGRGARNDLKDVTGGRLPFESLSQVAVSFVEFSKQPHVLNRDDGLVGEGLEQGDLVGGEAARFAACHRDRSERLVLAKQRYRR